MSNMSYCRFENTLSDLADCQEQLRMLLDGEPATKIGKNNERERSARIKLVEMCLEIAGMFEEATEAVDPRAVIESTIAEAEERQEELAENNDE